MLPISSERIRQEDDFTLRLSSVALSDLGQETQRLRVEVVPEVNAGLAAVALPATPPGNRCNNLPFSRRSA